MLLNSILCIVGPTAAKKKSRDVRGSKDFQPRRYKDFHPSEKRKINYFLHFP
jgi:hypothetical protein